MEPVLRYLQVGDCASQVRLFHTIQTDGYAGGFLYIDKGVAVDDRDIFHHGEGVGLDLTGKRVVFVDRGARDSRDRSQPQTTRNTG